MATKLRTQEVAALRRALDSERYATKIAQEKNTELQKTLDNERSAIRMLRRDVAAQVKAAREEESNKYNAAIEQLKTRMTLVQTEAVEMQKESTARALTAEFQREMHAREEELKKEARKQISLLQEQLKEAVKSQQQTMTQNEKDVLLHSMHVEYQRTLHAKQEEWKRETKVLVDNVTCQLRDAQRQCLELTNKLATTTNDAEQAHKLRQELQALKLHNKELDEKIQVLTESERRKVEEFRSQYEEFEARINEMQKAARKEAHQLLEEMKSKNRHIAELERELHLLSTRLDFQKELQMSFRNVSSSGLNSHSSSKIRLDSERPGEPPRLCMKRLKNPTFASELAKRVRGGEARPKPLDRNLATKDTIHTIEQAHDNITTMETETTETRTLPTLNKNRQLKNCTSEGTTTDDLINNSWTKVVGLDTLYKLLCEEHQELQRTYQGVCAKLREEERARVRLEEQLRDWKRTESENAINLAMADQIQALLDRQAELELEAQDLREQNDLLEFRILELDDSLCSHGSLHAKSPSSRTPDTRDVIEFDDISDSGVMSLTTSEDISEADFQDFKVEPNSREVKSRLAHMCQTVDNINDQVCLQQALTLLRHYESRLESLEATLAAMCQEATMSRSNSILSDTSTPLNSDTSKSPSRIIATVLPFTDLSTNCKQETQEEYPIKKLLKDVDCLQESGIFEGSSDSITQSTQTDWTADKYSTPPGDLGAEIRKLTQIRERIEEQGGNKKLLKVPESGDDDITHTTLKDLLFYRERLELLENKVAIYESRGDSQSKLLAARLEREVLLAAQVEFLKSTVNRLHEENRQLEEEKCEYEEAENDTRLRCQKLEVKLSALGEKKSDLQVQLQQNARTMSNLRSTLSEEEKKRLEAKQRLARLESALNQLEQQNFELEEREMEVRCKLQVLEVTLPALMVWFLWKMLNSVRPYVRTSLVTGNKLALKEIADSSTTDTPAIDVYGKDKRSQLKERLKKLELQLEIEAAQLHESKRAEEELKFRVEELEQIIKTKSQQKTEEEENLCLEPGNKEKILKTKCRELERRCKDLENKIKEYETREETYSTTIQEVDEFWAKEKEDLKDVIEKLEEKLMFKDKELDRVGTQVKRLSVSQEIEAQLLENIQQLHQEISELKEKLLQREKDNKAKELSEKELWEQLNEAVEQIEYFKTNVEVALKDEIKELKTKNKQLKQQLDIASQSEQESIESQLSIISELKSSLRKQSKDLEENEVNIGELKEEVVTLENALLEGRKELEQERNSREVYQIQVSAELAAKDEEIRKLSQELSHGMIESLADSMVADKDLTLGSKFVNDEDPSANRSQVNETEPQVDLDSTMDVTASRSQPTISHLPADCLRSQILAVEEEVLADVPIFVDRLQAALVDSIDCQSCKDKGTTKQLERILSTIRKVDSKTRDPGCFNSRLALERFHSLEVPRLRKALEHSKDCQNCGDNSITSKLIAILSRLQSITGKPLDVIEESGAFVSKEKDLKDSQVLSIEKKSSTRLSSSGVSGHYESDVLPTGVPYSPKGLGLIDEENLQSDVAADVSFHSVEIGNIIKIMPSESPEEIQTYTDKTEPVSLHSAEEQEVADQIPFGSHEQIQESAIEKAPSISPLEVDLISGKILSELHTQKQEELPLSEVTSTQEIVEQPPEPLARSKREVSNLPDKTFSELDTQMQVELPMPEKTSTQEIVEQPPEPLSRTKREVTDVPDKTLSELDTQMQEELSLTKVTPGIVNQPPVPLARSKKEVLDFDRVGFMPDLKIEESSYPVSSSTVEQLLPDVKSSQETLLPSQVQPLPFRAALPLGPGMIRPVISSTVDKGMTGPTTIPYEPQDTDSTQTTTQCIWTVNTLKSKCRVKDHFIKSLADQLKELLSHKVWSSNRLHGIISQDPVKTYDFDRVTLIEYIEGNPPPQLLVALQSEPDYSSTNVVDFKVINKYGSDCLLVGWSPLPSSNVLGFQIFVNGQLIQRVHSPVRNKALLHPIDFSKSPLVIQLFTTQDGGKTDEAARLKYPQ